MSEAETKAEERGKDGRFLTGNSGGGRPTGSRNKLGEQFLEKLAADFEKNGQDAIDRVRAEKPDAYLRTIAAILPVPKARAVQIDLPDLKSAQDGLDALNIIIRSVSAGELSVDEGQQLAALVGEHRKATEIVELEARIKALEDRNP